MGVGFFKNGFCIVQQQVPVLNVFQPDSSRNNLRWPLLQVVYNVQKILFVNKNHKDAIELLKSCINYGILNFKEDEFFSRIVKDYLKFQRT